MIIVNIDLLSEQAEKKPHEVHLEKAADIFSQSFKSVFDMADLGDQNKPLDRKILRSDPNHPIVRTIMYMYSLEPPFYRVLNRACREKDIEKLPLVGPFAAALGEIVRFQEANRDDRKVENFQVYRGLSLPKEDISGYKFISNYIKNLQVQNVKSDLTFHVEGFTSTSFDKSVAQEFAFKGVWGGRTPVLMEYSVELNEINNRYSGFCLNRPEYTAYPEENEFLLMDGADMIIDDVQILESENDVDGQYVVIKLRYINDWVVFKGSDTLSK